MSDIIIDCTGHGIRFIYDDRMQPLMANGEARITRASHVEPGDPYKGQDPLKWYADLAPVNGPILGGFPTRQQALSEEVGWLQTHSLGRESDESRHSASG